MAVSPLARPVTASELRFRVTVQSPTNPDPHTPDWGAATSYWANIEPLGAQAQLAQQVGGSQANFRITFRPEATVKQGDKITHGSTIYEVESVLHQPRARLMTMCRVTS